MSYVGTIIKDGDIADVDRIVTNGDGKEISPRFDIINHSHTGFCWGYYGSGPAQLALAILCDYLKDDERATLLYQRFKDRVIARLPRDENFVLSDELIENQITAITLEQLGRCVRY